MKLKSLVCFPIEIRRAHQILSNKPCLDGSLDQRPMALWLRTRQMMIDCGRHLAAMAHHCNGAGSLLHLCCDAMTLAEIARKPYGRRMLAMPGVLYSRDSASIPDDAVVMTDHALKSNHPANHRLGRRLCRLQIGRDIDLTSAVMPYPMHPSTLERISGKVLVDHRNHRRWFSILFAGNQKARYGDDKIAREFGILNRLEMLETVRDHFPDQIFDRIEAVKTSDGIVLADSRTSPISVANWLPAIASANFFLCCPGSSQPTCHHLIEAMSVGTIPILQYGDRTTPTLTDGVNAICFSDRASLIHSIERIASLSEGEIAGMRASVAKFYDKHLCGTRFIRNLRDGRESDGSCQRVCMPFHHQNFADDDGLMRAA